MESNFGCLSRRYSPHASSSSSVTPASPIADPHSRPFEWINDLHTGWHPNAVALRPTPSSPNPNYYSPDALQSDFSGLSLNDGIEVHRPPVYLNSGSTNGLDWNAVERLKESSIRSYFDRVRSSRSALPRILDDQGADPYMAAIQGAPFSGNLNSRDLLDRGYINGWFQGRTYQYNSPQFQSYQQPQNVFNGGARTYLEEGFRDYRMRIRRNSRPNLEIDTSSVDLTLLRGRLVSFAKDHHGCRILAAKIQDVKEEEIEMVLNEVIDESSDLMMDPNGTVFMQKLIDVCSEEQRSRLLMSITKDSRRFVRICCSNGSKHVQSLVDKLKSPQLITKFLVAIRPVVVDVIKDSNGYHAIKCCLNNFSVQQTKCILKEVVENCFELATDTYGCRVIYQCFDTCEGEDKEQLLSRIIENAFLLAKDCYGNYVLQFVLDRNDAEINSKIQKTLSGNFASLSFNKFGSHVVEKLITRNDKYQSSRIINELLKCPDLLLDPFGNYVMKTALSVAKGDTLKALFDLIKTHEPFLLHNQYGRKVIESYKRKKATPYMW